MAEPGLTEHLRDAIDLNRSRRAAYRRRGGLRADLLSRALVAAERALLPAARRLDREAARHAVPILRAELVDMALTAPAIRSLDVLATVQSREPDDSPSAPHPALWRTVTTNNFDAARRALAVRIEREHARERETGRRRALVLHLLESARLSAGRAVGYDRQTGGATRGLSRRIVLGHLALVPFARVLDRLAAPVHARGVGLFVHDVPPIPEP